MHLHCQDFKPIQICVGLILFIVAFFFFFSLSKINLFNDLWCCKVYMRTNDSRFYLNENECGQFHKEETWSEKRSDDEIFACYELRHFFWRDTFQCNLSFSSTSFFFFFFCIKVKIFLGLFFSFFLICGYVFKHHEWNTCDIEALSEIVYISIYCPFEE